MRKYKKELLPIKENERIYFDVPYAAKNIAQYTHCAYDPEKKLWFTGIHNANLHILIKAYGIDKSTPEKVKKQIEEVLDKHKTTQTQEQST